MKFFSGFMLAEYQKLGVRVKASESEGATMLNGILLRDRAGGRVQREGGCPRSSTDACTDGEGP